MPYELKGKCVYNKETGKKKGCSSSVEKAKAYMKALYASEPINEGLTDAVLDRANEIYAAMKSDKKAIRNAIKKHSGDAENILWGRAINTAKKQVQTMSETKLKDIIKKKLSEKPTKESFSKEYDNNPALKGGQKKLPDELQKSIINKKSVTEEVDYEGEMAKSELYRLVKNSQELMQMLDDDTQLEAWVQSKITKAADYIASVSQYLNFQAENKPEIDENTPYTLDK
jgi:macrodomain Ter protein organizer (MatP/YcbG family)